MFLFVSIGLNVSIYGQGDTAKVVATRPAAMYLFNESMLDDEDADNQNVSAVMTSANDVFTSNAGYAFSAMRFRIRGYNSEYTQSTINGVNFNELERGRFSYSMLGGLNDVVRNREDIQGSSLSDFSYGDIGGASNIVMRASQYSPGNRFSLAYTNRSYKMRGTYTFSTGLLPSGWAFTGALGYRWADEGYVEGTFYNSLGYLVALEKVINNKHSVSLTTFGAPTQRANQSANVQEVFDLTGTTTYNSYWGYQDGKKRSSRVVTTYEPVVLLTHIWDIDRFTKITSGLATRASGYGSTALAYNNASNPNPTYYRNLPSYQTTDEMKAFYTGIWQSGDASRTQVNWDRLYMVNKLANDVGQSARYILEERHNDQNEITFNSTINKRQNDNLKVTGGVEAKYNKGMHYKTIADMLGATRFRDVDQYTENYSPINPDIQYNDLNEINADKKLDDVIGYNYNIYVYSANGWFQNSYTYSNFDFYYGAKISVNSFKREGLMKNGRAPLNSYGFGDSHSFINQSVKGGFTWKPNGNHIVSLNSLYETRPPLPNNAYISPRTKDDAVKGLQSEGIFHADLNYNYNSRFLRGRVSVYHTRFNDQIEIDNFYNDELRTFTNSVMTGVDKIHQGIEVGLSGKITSELTATLIGSVGDYYYNSRPTATISVENGMQPDVTRTIYLKNFKVGGTPQTALNLEFSYAAPSYWFFDLGASYYDRNFVELTPIRRTAEILNFTSDSYDAYMDLAHKITDQEKYDAGFMVDASIGKSLRLRNGHQLNFNLQLSNLLNNTKLRTGGFEQGRFDYVGYNVDKFPPYYFYAQGFNCYLLMSYRF